MMSGSVSVLNSKPRKVYWPWPWLCPEFRLFTSDEDAWKALHRTNSEWLRWFWLWLVLFGVLGTSFVIGDLLPLCGANRIALYMTVALWNLIPTVVVVLIVRRKMRRSLRRILVEYGVPVCLECGYELRGLPTNRCPECGTSANPKPLNLVP